MSDDIDNYIPYLQEAASKVNVILEIGVGKGTGSTLAFARGLRGIHISVDHKDYMEMKPTSRDWGFILGDSRAIATFNAVELILDGRYPGIIFIDTDHTPCQITAELELWSKLAGNKTIWLFHDTYMMGRYNHMVDAIKEFAAKNNWVYEDVFTDPHGLGRMYRP